MSFDAKCGFLVTAIKLLIEVCMVDGKRVKYHQISFILYDGEILINFIKSTIKIKCVPFLK